MCGRGPSNRSPECDTARTLLGNSTGKNPRGENLAHLEIGQTKRNDLLQPKRSAIKRMGESTEIEEGTEIDEGRKSESVDM